MNSLKREVVFLFLNLMAKYCIVVLNKLLLPTEVLIVFYHIWKLCLSKIHFLHFF